MPSPEINWTDRTVEDSNPTAMHAKPMPINALGERPAPAHTNPPAPSGDALAKAIDHARRALSAAAGNADTEALQRWLEGYAEGALVPLEPSLVIRGLLADASAQRLRTAVWRALLAVPHGHWTTYGDLARAVGRPGAAQAVGQALGANPWPVLVPCHRVLNARGCLHGFALGLECKRALLSHEGLALDPPDPTRRVHLRAECEVASARTKTAVCNVD